MSYIFLVKNGWNYNNPQWNCVISPMIEKGYAVILKERTPEKIVIAVRKTHCAEMIFSKYFINDLRIEIKLENYFFRVEENIATLCKKFLPDSGLGCVCPPISAFPLFLPLQELLYLVAIAGKSEMPYELLKILGECFDGEIVECSICNSPGMVLH